VLQTALNTATDGSSVDVSSAAGLPAASASGAYLILIQNTGSHTAYVGPSSLSASSYQLAAGKELRLPLSNEHLYVATASGESTTIIVLIVQG
jgi:hypothetical protein